MEELEYISVLQQLDEYLDNKHLKRTEERHMVLKVICTFKSHFDVNMLYDQLQAVHFTVSRATIYNTLELLINAGVIIRHPLHGGLRQYELCQLAANHTHLVCTRCGCIRELSMETQAIDLPALRKIRFTPTHQCLYIYGLCHKCKQQKKAEAVKAINKRV